MTEGAGGRGLVLAGGGIRVAWQTGVVTALSEAGLTFGHLDGSSGGIFTTAMLLSGRTPQEMGDRWRSLDIRAFVSPLPLRAYLRSPTNWVAFGGSRGIRRTVLPHLGIDLDRVRAATSMSGSFNVADFATKTCVAIPHPEIDEERLIAGISLAGLMPAIDVDGRPWTDAVWIKDANLTETVLRGCREIWVVWCIANNPRWGTGALEQYVHMIEMSAVAGLTTELEWIAEVNRRRQGGEPVHGALEPIVVHLIKPALPIPLDPDFVLGRIDAETLVAMGYRDAWRYLRDRNPAGVPLDASPTATSARSIGARLVLRADGTLASAGRAASTLVLEADDLAALVAGTSSTMPVVGALRTERDGYCMFTTASAGLTGPTGSRRLDVHADLMLGGSLSRLDVEITLSARHRGSARRQRWTLRDDTGRVLDTGGATMSRAQALRTLVSFEPSGAHDLRDRWRALRLAVALLLGRH